MFNKIAGWSVFVLVVLLAIGAIVSDNKHREFRNEVAYCVYVKNNLKSEIFPLNVISFCKKIEKEIAARETAINEYRLRYLEERAQEIE